MVLLLTTADQSLLMHCTVMSTHEPTFRHVKKVRGDTRHTSATLAKGCDSERMTSTGVDGNVSDEVSMSEL
jgi:hypothetical protein